MDSTCPMCWLPMPRNVINYHIGSAHKDEPNFIVRCDFPGCNKTYNVWKSYRQHNWRKHNRNLRDLNDIERLSSSESESGSDDDFEHGYLAEGDLPVIPQLPALENPLHEANMTAQEKLQQKTALFVASIKENLLVPQSTLDSIVEGTCKLIGDYLQITRDTLIGDDIAESIPADAVKEAFRSCNPTSIFKHCASQHKVESFMTQNLNRLVPEKVTLGSIPIWSKTGQLVDKDCYAYIPPFKQSLEACLNNPDILHCVENPLPHEEGRLY